jgi:hypothetical protein
MVNNNQQEPAGVPHLHDAMHRIVDVCLDGTPVALAGADHQQQAATARPCRCLSCRL